MSDLIVKIAEYTAAENWEDVRQILKDSPELLDEEADHLLSQLIDLNQKHLDFVKAEVYADRLDLLHECSRLGIDRAVDNLINNPDHVAIPDLVKSEVDRIRVPYEQFQRTRSISDLDLSIELSRELLAKLVQNPEFVNFKINLQNDTAGMFLNRYWLTSNLHNLDESIKLWQDAREQIKVGISRQDHLLNNLGTGLSTRYERSGDLSDLQTALEYYRKALEVSPYRSRNRDAYAGNLGNALRDHYAITGNKHDLEDAIHAYELALKLAPGNSSKRPMHYNNLATAWQDRYDLTGSAEDLDQAIKYWQTAIDSTDSQSPASDRAMYLSNLATGLSNRFESRGDLDDLQASIQYHHKAIELAPHGTIQLPGYLANLGSGLWRHYVITGNLADLDNAFDATQKALELLPSTAMELPSQLITLGNIYSAKYQLSGDIRLLDFAINCWQRAVNLTSAKSQVLPSYLGNLASGFYNRYKRLGDTNDMIKAIKHVRKAIRLSSPNPTQRAKLHNNLGNYLHASYKKDHNVKKLNNAIRQQKKALHLSTVGTADWLLYLSNVLVTLYSRYEITQDLHELDLLINSWKTVVLHTNVDSPNRAAKMNTMGSLWWEKYKRTNDVEALNEGISALIEACQKGLEKAPEEALKSAKNWGSWAMERQAWNEGVQAFEYASEAITQLIERQLIRQHKEAWLREAQTVPSRGAYCLAKTGDLTSAVAYLEAGRTRILIEALEKSRQDLENLNKIGRQDLYDRYRSASARLAVEESQYHLSDSNQISYLFTPDDSEHLSAEHELKEVIEEIRNVDNFADFFRPWSFADIASSVDAKTLAYLIVTPVGGLILTVHSGEARAIWININDKDLKSILIESRTSTDNEGYLAAQLGRTPIQPALDEILPAIGEKIAEPLAKVLRASNISEIVLIPVGRIALLPIHSAVYLRDKIERVFLDEFTVSYAPSARALYHSLERARAFSPAEHHLLAIGNPQPLPTELPGLLYSSFEIEGIAKLFKGKVSVLSEEGATYSAVINALNNANHVHFASHAIFESDSPLDSGLLLSNQKRLTLNNLLALGELKNIRLAVLSACQTSIVDFERLPEEAIGFPGGFLQSGIPGVIGSLWPVDDISTAFLMIYFYQMYVSGTSPEEALRQAQLWLRDANKSELLKYSEELSVKQLEKISKRLLFEDKEARPFAHPYYWAGFIFHGT